MIKKNYILIKPVYKKYKSTWKSIKLNYKPSLKQSIKYNFIFKKNLKHNNKLMVFSSSEGFLTNFDLLKKKCGGVLLFTITL